MPSCRQTEAYFCMYLYEWETGKEKVTKQNAKLPVEPTVQNCPGDLSSSPFSLHLICIFYNDNRTVLVKLDPPISS